MAGVCRGAVFLTMIFVSWRMSRTRHEKEGHHDQEINEDTQKTPRAPNTLASAGLSTLQRDEVVWHPTSMTRRMPKWRILKEEVCANGCIIANGAGMTSQIMMMGLVVFYLLVAGVSAMETNWPRVLYWISAAGITTAVLWGTR